MKGKKIINLFYLIILVNCVFPTFEEALKDEDFMGNKSGKLDKKKFQGLSEKTVYNIWKNASDATKSEAFNHLETINSIKYSQINSTCDKCKKNKMVLINGNKYFYSNIIYTNSKNINENELVDIYVLFNLICAVKKRNEIFISEESLKTQDTKDTESIVVNRSILPKNWDIPVLANQPIRTDITTIELINKFVYLTSPTNNLLFFTENKWIKLSVPLISTSLMAYNFNRANSWANYSTSLENSGETNIISSQQLASSNHDAAINFALTMGIVSIYTFYDWFVNIND